MEKEELKKKLNDLITKFIDENAYTQGEDHIQTHYTVKLLEYLGWQGKNAKIKKTQDIKNQKIPDITSRKFCDGVRKTGIGVVYSPAS
jgi:hypothetical protein